MENNSKFIICAAGIFFSYSIYGILQERITKGNYSYESVHQDGSKSVLQERYTYFLTLVFVQSLINYILAKVILNIWPHGEDKTRTVYYSSVSLTYLLAMVSSNMSLQWVSYPTQVIGKSVKPIPVMMLGVLLAKKSYSWKKYAFVFIIVFGVIVFMFKDKSMQKQDTMFGLGELLLVLSLIMDGLTGAIQEKIRAEAKPTGLQLMKTSNGWASAYLGLALLVTGESMLFFEFAKRHPDIIVQLLILGVTQAVGQVFLYTMVSNFGPLAVSVVTTTRKFFTVLASVVLFNNVLSSRQWIGAVIVFSGLFLEAFFSKGAPKKVANEK